jgi:hypothetical protein
MPDNDNAEEQSFLGDFMPEFNIESFTEVPSCFLLGLTPEQIVSKGQLYRTAFEKAREATLRKTSDRRWLEENGLTFGDGI